jgi:hypothetical protein
VTDEVAALARKYAALVELRRRRDAGSAAPAASALRALAREFPGCLRELDTLGLAELERRASSTRAAVTGGPTEPWMAWIGGYHALMRAAFALRDPARAATVEVDATFAAAVRSPPEGRVSIVVLRALAVRFDVPAAEIAAALFPVRRPSPYAL